MYNLKQGLKLNKIRKKWNYLQQRDIYVSVYSMKISRESANIIEQNDNMFIVAQYKDTCLAFCRLLDSEEFLDSGY